MDKEIHSQNQEECSGKTSIKKRRKIDWLLAAVSITGIVALFLLHPLLAGLIETATYMYDGVNDMVESVIWVDETDKPTTLEEKIELYKDLTTQNYNKYNEKVVQKIADSVIDYNKNYNATIVTGLYVNEISMRISIDMDVDGNAAAGTITISYQDPLLSKDDIEQHEWEYEYPFVRILENNEITTYINVDGTWYKRDGFAMFDNHVAIDLCKLTQSYFNREYTYYPTASGYDSPKGWISMFRDETHAFTDFGNALYEDCDAYSSRAVSFDLETYRLISDVELTYYVDENKMRLAGEKIGDPTLDFLCDREFTMFYAFSFNSYGESKVELPNDLSDAVEVENYSMLTTDFVSLVEKFDDYEE